MIRIVCLLVANELRLLFRDRAGLALLFLMPAVLVVVVSLVQDNVMKTSGESGVQVLFINRDDGETGRVIQTQLKATEAVQLVAASKETTDETALKFLADGKYQVCLIVPEGLSKTLKDRVAGQVQTALQNTGDSSSDTPSPLPELLLLFDPLMQGSFRLSVINAIHRMMLMIEMEAKIRALAEAFPRYSAQLVQAFCRSTYPRELFPRVDAEWGRKPLLDLHIRQSGRGDFAKLPTSLQHNAPAWSLFGMFFIVVPLSGALIRERQEGVLKRLMTLPVSYSLMISGKVLAYMLICMIQFGLIITICKTLMPLLGTESLEIAGSLTTIPVVAVSIALAAAGYGVMVGTLAESYEQASMFGAITVVIAAALGGIMVPVFAMPPVMQDISRISPLGWGLDALTGIFVRGYGLQEVWGEILCLLGFAAGTVLIGWRGFLHRAKRL